MRCFYLLLFGLLLSLLLAGSPVLSAEIEKPVQQSTPSGGAEVIPRLADLKQKSADVKAKLEVLQKTSTFTEPMQIARERAKALNRETEFLTGATEWNFDRLLDTRGQLVGQKDYLATLVNGVSLRLKELDSLRKKWQERQTFWKEWRKNQPENLLKTQKQAFREAEIIIKTTQQQIVDASKPLVVLQDEVVQMQEKNQLMLSKVDEMLETLRGKIFQKTARSFTSPDFYRKFDRSLLNLVKKGVEGVSGSGSGFYRMQGWLIALQLLLATTLGGFLLHKRRHGTVRDEWKFIIGHPLATAIFVSIITVGSLFSTPPALWRWLLSTLAAFSAATLVSGLLDDIYKKLMIYILAGVFVVTMGLQMIALPLPLYRVYLALLSLLGVPFLLIVTSRHRKVPGRRNDLFTLVLRLGVIVLVCSFAAQWGGFSTLSSRLVESSIKTVFLGLIAWMTLHLGRGGCEYLLNLPILQRSRFVSRFGEELEARLKKVLLVIILFYAIFYLFEIWGVSPSAGQAWKAFLQLGYKLGDKKISMYLVLLAVLALYASIQGSWILRALLDTEFFPHRPVDRGVHDSIMKLLHYGVITFGFLLAMSMLGFELKNLVVLAGALGIGIGFGLQNIVNNFVSGLILLFERPVKVGDMIMIESDWCLVRKIGMRATTVETFDQSEIIVPNSDLISQKVTNWTLTSEQSRVVISVGVAYGSDVENVLKVLTECALEHPKVLAEPPPSPLFMEFGDSSLNFELRAWVARASDRMETKSDLLKAIDHRFRQEGVEIPFPQRDLHLRSIDEKALEKLRKQD
jgi:potassium efflux system protein